MKAKIHICDQLGRTVYVTLSPDGDECHQFDALSPAELFCSVEYGAWEVIQ